MVGKSSISKAYFSISFNIGVDVFGNNISFDGVPVFLGQPYECALENQGSFWNVCGSYDPKTFILNCW